MASVEIRVIDEFNRGLGSGNVGKGDRQVRLTAWDGVAVERASGKVMMVVGLGWWVWFLSKWSNKEACDVWV